MSPESAQQLAEIMATANTRAEKVAAVDLRQMHRVLELAPEDMTVTVETGCSLEVLQKELAKHQQWLPIDPPNASAVSIHEVLSKNLSGPRRFGYGTIREHLIGMKVVLADGRTIKSGGKVVKNVAGYDLAKLFIGAGDSLGVIVEATFKLRPLPENERFIAVWVETITDAAELVRAALNSDITPVVLDLHRACNGKGISVVLGFAGTHAEVDWQYEAALALGFTMPASLEDEREFWNNHTPVNRLSVLPTRLWEKIAALDERPFVARAGNGLIYYRGELIERQRELPLELMRRVKSAYDPKNIFPEFTP